MRLYISVLRDSPVSIYDLAVLVQNGGEVPRVIEYGDVGTPKIIVWVLDDAVFVGYFRKVQAEGSTLEGGYVPVHLQVSIRRYEEVTGNIFNW